MRKIEYLSPSAITLYTQDKELYYSRYICSDRLDREPQTQPMSVGSAFDSYVKSYLHERLFGKGNDPRFDFNTLFEAQVESRNRDWARIHGKYCFDCYQSSGALSDLMLELHESNVIGKPKFEIEIKGVVEGYREGITSSIGGVTLLGKPDLFYMNKHGVNIVLDWKVNGYLSKYNVSPKPGYVRIRQDKKNSGQHKDCVLGIHNGVIINTAMYLEDIDIDWARQLSIYAWLGGARVGESFITAIDQLVCNQNGTMYPSIRIAEHRLKVKSDFQYQQFAIAQELWEATHSDHFFREMTKEDSIARCRLLDKQAETLRGDGTAADRIFLEITR